MLAPDGRCKTLDASADGYVRAENCIVMVLQPADGVSSSACGLLAASAVGQVPTQWMLDAKSVCQKQGLCALHADMHNAKLGEYCCKAQNMMNPQDGRSSSLTAPSGPAQQDVIRTALAAGDILPLQVRSHGQHCCGYATLAVETSLHPTLW